MTGGGTEQDRWAVGDQSRGHEVQHRKESLLLQPCVVSGARETRGAPCRARDSPTAVPLKLT